MIQHVFRNAPRTVANARVPIPLLLALCGGAMGTGSANAAVVNSQWAAAVSGFWGVNTNWTPQTVPDNGVDTYNVSMPLDGPYVVTLDNNFTINDLDVSGDQVSIKLFSSGTPRPLNVQGTLSLGGTASIVGDDVGLTQQGTMTVGGDATIHGGTVAHLSAFNLTHNLTLSAKSPIDFDDTHVDHSGTACVLTGPSAVSFNSSTLTFESGSTFTMQSNAPLVGTGVGSTLTLQSGASLVKADATTTTTTGLALVNSGSLTVQGGGTLSTDGVALTGGGSDTLSSGKWTVKTGSTLALGAGQNILHNGADVTLDGAGATFGAFDKVQTNDASGKLTVSTGRNFTTDTNFTNSGQLTIGAATDFKVKSGSSLGNISGGAMSGGTFNVSGRLLVDGANVTSITSSLTLDGASAAFVDGTNTALSGIRNLSSVGSGGAVKIKNGNNYTQGAATLDITSGGTFDVGVGSTLTIPSTKTFTAQSGSTFANIGATTSGGGIVVSGTLKTPTSSITTIGSKITLSRDAGQPVPQITDLSNADALSQVSSISSTGDFSLLVAPGGTPTTYTTLTPSFNVSSGGNITVGKNATFNIPAGTLANIGTSTLDLGRFTIQGQIRTNFTAPAALTLTNTTTLDGPASSIYDITTNTDLFSSLTTIDTGGDLSLLNGRALTLTQPLTVKGKLTVGNTAAGGRPSGGEPVTPHWDNPAATTRGTGTFEILSVGGDLHADGGTITLDTGRIEFTNGGRLLQPTGTFMGSGQIAGDFHLAGGVGLRGGTGGTATISPGIGQCDIGTVSIFGNLNAGAGSIFEIDVGTDGGQTVHDTIEVIGGNSIIDPSTIVRIHICDDFVPVVGAMIPIINFGAMFGAAGGYEGLVKENGITLTPVYSGSQLYLQVVSVPAPGSAGVVVLGALGMLRRRRVCVSG